MTQFKHAITQLLRLSPKFRRSLRQPCAASPSANVVVTTSEHMWLRKLVHLRLGSKVQPPTDTSAREVEAVKEVEEYVEEYVREYVKEYVGHDEEYDEEYDWGYDDEEDTPETFPYDLVKKTYIEMMIYRLYVAVADNDREIAALRTRRCETFSHIVRISFEPLSPGDRITTSSWKQEELYPEDGPSELRLTCPTFTLGVGEEHTGLTETQLLAARNYITLALPERNGSWKKDGPQFPFSPEECEDARLLIVGPTDREVDVMAILVCYLAFLTGWHAKELVSAVSRFDTLVHKHWQNCVLGATTVGMADAAAKHPW